MHQVKLTSRESRKIDLHWKPGAIFSALMASLVLQLFRMDQHRGITIMWIEYVIFLILPIAFFLFVTRWTSRNESSNTQTTTAYLAQGGAVAIALLLIVAQMIDRSVGLGDANELVALLVLQGIGWHLAIFASVRGFERASLLICGAIVFFVCCMSQRLDVLIAGALFAISSLWWLAGLYWSRLDSKAIDGNSKVLTIHASTTGITAIVILLCLAIASLVPISNSQFSLAGFMPFSGGEDGYEDEFAASGVGDGNMLTAGNNATTTGAVDSDEFIEDDKPSIYDVMSDQYEGPVFKNQKRKRAIPLDVKAKHIHGVKQSEQAGRSFRTMRNTDRELDTELEDRISKALLQIEGSVPARFVIDCFHQFDGWDWSKVDIANENPLNPRIKIFKSLGKPFFKLQRVKEKYLTENRTHRIKIMRFENPNLPTTSFLNNWHIAKVDDVTMFSWDDSGVVKFAGEMIPPQTVVDVNGFVPNYHLMRDDRALSRYANSDSDSLFLQVPDTDSKDRIASLAAQYTAGSDTGWNQVEAIVQRFRNDFELDPEWEVSETVDDTVGHFLDQNGGPSYMFATSCAMALRSAGYPTRLASGFLIQQEDYDRRSRQSIVTTRNLHMWPEVCLDGKYWIPVEPTPGYPIPYSTETLWQWAKAAFHAYVVAPIRSHPFISTIIALAFVLSYVYRAIVVTNLMLLWWHFVRIVWPQRILETTRQLIDVRFWFAGDARPESRTIQSWYTRVEPGLSSGFFELWNFKNYCSRPLAFDREDTVSKCQEQISAITLKKIQQLKANQALMENS